MQDAYWSYIPGYKGFIGIQLQSTEDGEAHIYNFTQTHSMCGHLFRAWTNLRKILDTL